MGIANPSRRHTPIQMLTAKEHRKERWFSVSASAAHKGQRACVGRPRRASLSAVQHRLRRASHTWNSLNMKPPLKLRICVWSIGFQGTNPHTSADNLLTTGSGKALKSQQCHWSLRENAKFQELDSKTVCLHHKIDLTSHVWVKKKHILLVYIKADHT
jgi:hypothetical protein